MSITNIKQIAETIIELSYQDKNKEKIANLLNEMKKIIKSEGEKYV
ncbi:MAG: hypothetical protein ISS01_02550 [Nanoarchaeota archaeon]|nr:hypothetical protein [Nanoarchaeota archaeon]